MKQKIVVLIAAITFLFAHQVAALDQSSSSGEDIQQALVPKEVFVGDSAQVQYMFRSAVDFFALAPDAVVGDTLHISVHQKPFTDMTEKCTVSKVELVRKDFSYTLIITFVPWQPGKIEFGTFDLNAASRNSSNVQKGVQEDSAPFEIDFAPVTIASLSEMTGSTTLRPPISPITVPGTNYIVWLFIIIAILLLFTIGMLLAKLPKVIRKFRLWKRQIEFLKNTNITNRRLRKLQQKKQLDDSEFAAEWQSIMRTYLSNRFGQSFESVASSRIAASVRNCTGNMLSDEQQDTVDELEALFRRTDYIRFAPGSVDAELLPLQEHQALFAEEERVAIATGTGLMIKKLELEKKTRRISE